MGLGVQRYAPVVLPHERGPVESAPRPVWSGTEKLAPIGIGTPKRPARSESLYRLSYLGPQTAIIAYMKKPKVYW